jgi:hypothetical protein
MLDARFASERRYQATAPPADLLADLEHLAALHREAEERRRGWMYGVWGSLALFPIGLIGAFAGQSPAPMVLCLIGVLAAMFCGIMAYLAARGMLDQRRLAVATTALRHLACDMPTAPARLDLDFNDYHHERYCSVAFDSGRRAYQLPWLTLEGPLLDGTRFSVQAMLRVSRKERRKPKGTKVKEVFAEELSLMMKVRNRSPEELQRVPTLIGTPMLPGGVALRGVRVTGNRLMAVARSPQRARSSYRGNTTDDDAEQKLPGADAVLVLFLTCYAALRRCRPQRWRA